MSKTLRNMPPYGKISGGSKISFGVGVIARGVSQIKSISTKT